MVPAQFDYHQPATLDEALALLQQHADDAKILAGGHSLIPAMKLRLAQPAVLIDIGRIRDLAYIREEGEILREIRIPVPAGRYGQAYAKAAQPASGFAVVGVAVHLVRDAGGACQSASVGITGVASKAYRAKGVEAALTGSALDEQAIANAATTAADGVTINGDIYASEAYR